MFIPVIDHEEGLGPEWRFPSFRLCCSGFGESDTLEVLKLFAIGHLAARDLLDGRETRYHSVSL